MGGYPAEYKEFRRKLISYILLYLVATNRRIAVACRNMPI